MSEYQFHPTLVLRSPVYHYQLYSEDNLAVILKESFFQNAIYFASDVFYNELKKNDFDLNKLDKKAVETVRKYFNRICYRPTPFGIYAAIGSLQWDDKKTNIQFLQNNLHPNIKLSYAKSIELSQQLLKDDTITHKYKLSTAIYSVANEFRFIRQVQSVTAQIDFRIDSIKSDQFIKALMRFLLTERTVNEIHKFVHEKTDCDNEQVKTYINWLVDSDLVINVLVPNITGNDYLERVVEQDSLKTNKQIAAISSVVKTYNTIKTVAEISTIHHNTSETCKSADLYVNLQIKLPNASLNSKYQQDILDGIYCLNRLNDIRQPKGIEEFVRKFNRKFENRAIPILYALDPEIGVGYGNLAEANHDLDIVKDILNLKAEEKNSAINWSRTHVMLFKKWNAMKSKEKIINITADDLELISKEEDLLPPSMSVMFRVVDDGILIENAGGVTATALIGRFTPLDADIEILAKDISSKECEYNAGVIFAEIAHVCNAQTANIDRRVVIYPYEIPILVEQVINHEYQIPLSDLWVSVVNGEIILQSKKHNKRVIPRLSSAFNYTRNDLAVFRFLCDLQHQGIKTSLNFDLNKFFPGLDFYPRVVYNNIILQLAYWVLDNKIFESAIKAQEPHKATFFKQLKENLALPEHVALTQHDNQLIFDFGKESEVLFFLDVIKTQSQFIIKEYLLPRKTAVVTNSDNQSHVNQFIASLYQTSNVYKPILTHLTKINKERRKIIPGEEWLYFKIYCHPIRSNELLGICLFKTLNKLLGLKLIEKYFFIRYFDPEYHIRLRLKVSSGNHQEVLTIMHQAVNKYIKTHTISNYLIDTYERELERYQPLLMDEFEHSFYASSNLIMRFLSKAGDEIKNQNILDFATVSVNDILATLGLNGQQLITFLESMFTQFSVEFNKIDNLKYQLDTEYRKQKISIEVAAKDVNFYYENLSLLKPRTLFIESLNELRKKCEIKDIVWQYKWVADIIHMHLNRLFITESRKQEMATYYFLIKYHKSIHGRSKRANV